MSAVDAEGIDLPVGIEFSEFGQGNDAGDTVMAAGLNQTQIDGQITLQFGIINGQNIFRMAVEIAAMVAIPAMSGIGIGKDARTVAIEDAQLATGTLFASPGRTAGQDTGAIPGNSQFPGIPEQTLSGSRFYPNFGKDLLHEPLWTILEGSALGQPGQRIFGRCLVAVLAASHF